MTLDPDTRTVLDDEADLMAAALADAAAQAIDGYLLAYHDEHGRWPDQVWSTPMPARVGRRGATFRWHVGTGDPPAVARGYVLNTGAMNDWSAEQQAAFIARARERAHVNPRVLDRERPPC